MSCLHFFLHSLCFFCLVRANSCWRLVALARRCALPVAVGRRLLPGTSQLLLAIGCACSPLCIARRRRETASRYEPTPVGDLLRLLAVVHCPSPSGDGSPVRANSCWRLVALCTPLCWRLVALARRCVIARRRRETALPNIMQR